jgi:malate/lactate dehydrogenase
VPCKLGRRGLEQILQVELTAQEQTDLKASAESVLSVQAGLAL